MVKITKEAALSYHETGRPGKIEVKPTKPYHTQTDLSLAYSPGVAFPCLEIQQNPDDAYKYTDKGNLVAVISNGTAVLGLGDIGAMSGKPVMEGKGLLFKIYGGVDVFDIEIDEKDPEKFCETVEKIAPTFGGINLEDIKAPQCFYIEERLKKTLDIPVMHDDQHGTAIISAAGLKNALEVAGKNIADVKIVVNGAGAAAISCTKLYVALGAQVKNIVMLDSKGVITSGFSGAGAFSDGKLSLSYQVGGELPDLIGEDFAQELIDYTDKIYLEFGADPKVEGIYEGPDIKDIRKRAIQAGLQLVDCPIRHLGTEKAQQLYLNIQNYLADAGVEMLFSTECENIILEDSVCKGVRLREKDGVREVYAKQVVIATGRRGADWLEKICAEHNIAHKPGTVDIGVRVECRNEIMEKINKVLYEGKLIGYPAPWRNKVRTFCQNPGGFVAQENYDNDLAVVNGHSFKEKKSNNTNLAILVSHNFTEPFNQPIAYAQKVGELTNMLGAGHILVQRYGDILDGKRTWANELARTNVRPTLKDAVAGDITAAMPYRAMVNIIEFIKMMDEVVPGFASPETLLYSPELKFYSNKVKMDTDLETNIAGLHCLGDSSGWTRGLMMASVMGVLMGRKLMEKHGF